MSEKISGLGLEFMIYMYSNLEAGKKCCQAGKAAVPSTVSALHRMSDRNGRSQDNGVTAWESNQE